MALPTLDDVLDTVADQRPTYWTSLDLRSGYHQTTLDPETSDRTAFSTHENGELPLEHCLIMLFHVLVCLAVFLYSLTMVAHSFRS
jgi:hypothetical protein